MCYMIFPWRRVWSFIWTNLNFYPPRMLLSHILKTFSPMAVKMSMNYFSLFCCRLPFDFIWIPISHECFVWIWLKVTMWFWLRRLLNVGKLYFQYWGCCPLFEKKLKFPSLKDALCQVWLKFVQWFCMEKIFKSRQCIFTMKNSLYHFPLENGLVHHLNKLEFPSPKDVLCQLWVILLLIFI